MTERAKTEKKCYKFIIVYIIISLCLGAVIGYAFGVSTTINFCVKTAEKFIDFESLKINKLLIAEYFARAGI